MPNRPYVESEAIRRWIKAALQSGANSPRRVQAWMDQNANIDAPSIPTIAQIMKDEGYEPVGYVWEKKKGK